MKKGRKHSNCDNHPSFDLDEKVFINGEYYTKEQILKYKQFAESVKELEAENKVLREILKKAEDMYLLCYGRLEQTKQIVEKIQMLYIEFDDFFEYTDEHNFEKLQYWENLKEILGSEE